MSSEKLPPLIPTAPGLYRHYKGNLYEVIGTARHSETCEPMTLYKKWGQIPISSNAKHPGKVSAEPPELESDPHLDAPHLDLWVRPAAMFEEWVLVDGIQQPRFAKISNEKQL